MIETITVRALIASARALPEFVGAESTTAGCEGNATKGTVVFVSMDDPTLLPIFRAFAFVFGLLWGSFLNVVIYRLPRELSVVRPASHCPACGKPIPAYRNIPVVSYLLQRGKAACCGAKMSPRYVMVELIGGVLALAIFEALVVPYGMEHGTLPALALFLVDFAAALALVAAAFIDMEQLYLPDPLTYGTAALGLLSYSLRGRSLVDVLGGAALGFLVVWFLFGVLYRRLRGKTGMGLGDAKLLMAIGAFFGWVGAVLALAFASFQAVFAVLVIKLSGRSIELPQAVQEDMAALKAAAEAGDEEAKKLLEEDVLAEEVGEGVGSLRIAFGPFLVLAFLELLLFESRILGALMPQP